MVFLTVLIILTFLLSVGSFLAGFNGLGGFVNLSVGAAQPVESNPADSRDNEEIITSSSSY